MRTFGVLVAGWLLGGAMIVLLALAAPAPVALATRTAPASSVSGRTLSAPTPAGHLSAALAGAPMRKDGFVLVPVVGVTADKLQDSFSQPRSGGRMHEAMDILAPRGTPVVAAVDGTVRKLDTSRAGGISIYQFDRAEEHVYYYAHLDRYADGLAEGQFVAQGTVIGYVGTTGNAPAGTPHLHFSVEVLPPSKEWWKGDAVNPYPLLAGS